jgi:hypothetical protein
LKTDRITSKVEYNIAMNDIEVLLQKASELVGFENMSKSEKPTLAHLSVMVEQFEDDN